MPARRPSYVMHFFVLRLWQEAIDGDSWEWRGEVKNTTSGETRYFRDWHTLVHLLPTLLAEPVGPGQEDEPDMVD